MSRLAVPFALLLLPLSVVAATPDDVRKIYPVRVSVDAAGNVTATEALATVPAALESTVFAAAAAAVFEPATKEGVPVPSRTSVQVDLALAPVDDGYAVRVTDVRQGGHWTLAPPVYPRDALVRRASANVVMTLVFGADGKPDMTRSQVDLVENPRLRRDGTPRPVELEEQFRAAALDAAKRGAYLPDEVDGEPIAGTFRAPITFCAGSGGCTEQMRALNERIDSRQVAVDEGIRLAALRDTPSNPLN